MSSDEGYQKYKPPRHPLLLENQLRNIVPTEKFINDRVSRYLTYQHNNARSPGVAAATAAESVRLAVEGLRSKINTEWVDGFRAWLLGNSKYNTDQYFTPWGRKPLVHIDGVVDWIDAEIDMHHDFRTKLQLLYIEGPGDTLERAYLYYKFVVCGLDWAVAQKHTAGDGKQYPPWFDRKGQIEFLDMYGDYPGDGATGGADHPGGQTQGNPDGSRADPRDPDKAGDPESGGSGTDLGDLARSFQAGAAGDAASTPDDSGTTGRMRVANDNKKAQALQTQTNDRLDRLLLEKQKQAAELVKMQNTLAHIHSQLAEKAPIIVQQQAQDPALAQALRTIQQTAIDQHALQRQHWDALQAQVKAVHDAQNTAVAAQAQYNRVDPALIQQLQTAIANAQRESEATRAAMLTLANVSTNNTEALKNAIGNLKTNVDVNVDIPEDLMQKLDDMVQRSQQTIASNNTTIASLEQYFTRLDEATVKWANANRTGDAENAAKHFEAAAKNISAAIAEKMQQLNNETQLEYEARLTDKLQAVMQQLGGLGTPQQEANLLMSTRLTEILTELQTSNAARSEDAQANLRAMGVLSSNITTALLQLQNQTSVVATTTDPELARAITQLLQHQQALQQAIGNAASAPTNAAVDIAPLVAALKEASADMQKAQAATTAVVAQDPATQANLQKMMELMLSQNQRAEQLLSQLQTTASQPAVLLQANPILGEIELDKLRAILSEQSTATVADLEGRMKTVLDGSLQSTAQTSALQATVSRLEQEREEARRTAQTYQQREEQTNAQLQAMQQALGEKNAVITQLSKAQQEHEAAKQQTTALRDEITSAKALLENSNSTVVKLQQEIEQFHRDAVLDEVRVELLAKAETHLRKEQAKVAELNATLSSKESELEAESIRRRSRDAEITRLKRQAQESETANNSTVLALQSQLAKLQGEAQVWQADYTTQRQTLMESLAELRKQQGQLQVAAQAIENKMDTAPTPVVRDANAKKVQKQLVANSNKS